MTNERKENIFCYSLSLSIDNCYMQRLLFHAILEEAKTEFDRIARARKKRKRNDAFSLDKRVFAFNRIVEKVTFGQWSIFWSTTRRKKMRGINLCGHLLLVPLLLLWQVTVALH